MQLPTGVIEELLELGIKKGEFREVDRFITAVMIAGMLDNCIEFIKKGLLDDAPELLFLKMWDLVYHGIKKRE